LDRHYDLRTKQEAREQRRRELQKHIDGYEVVGTDDESMFDGIKSIRTAGSTIMLTIKTELNNLTGRSRKIKATVGFACYLVLIVADLWLINIENILNFV
jgi:hypothetical protein